MISIIKADGTSEVRQLEAMRARAAQKNADIELAVSAVMQNVKENGLSAVRDYSRQFDHREPYELTRAQLEEAYRSCPAELIAALEHAAANIRDYNEKLLSRTMEWTSPDGGRVGRIVRGLSRVGIYVPGGTAAYPSSVLMNAVPAKVAGVEEIVMVTPPTENLNAAVLAAARIAGVDRCIAVGGAQAVAALTYGAGFIPRVDKLVGPGNAYVAAAKRLAYGSLDIDMVAGPSEVLVIADRPADPKYVAADLLSQAEHDVFSSAVLVTDSLPLAQAVQREVEVQLERLPRREIARRSVEENGKILLTRSLDAAVDAANRIAPEHLELCVEDPFALLPRIRNAGSIFLGRSAPEALGDYFAGPNHTLPTSGTARFSSPLGVDDFIKRSSFLYYSQDVLAEAAPRIAEFARREGLEGHARSVLIRCESETKEM